MPLLTNLIKSTRHRKVSRFVSGDVLEMACGPADILKTHGDVITRYCGIEYTASRVEKLRSLYPDHEFHQADLDEDSLPIDGQFDVVLMLALVEHIYNQKHLFKEATRLLRPGGRIVATTPTPFGNDIVHRTGARLGLFSKVAADDHIVIYNKKRFQILASDFGLSIERYERFQFGCNQLVILSLP